MIGDIKLIKEPDRQRTNSQYKLEIDVKNNTLVTIPKAKFIPDYSFNINLPWDYAPYAQKANMVFCNSSFYDIVNFDYRTNNEKSFTLSLELEPISTFLKYDTLLNGWFTRSNVLTNYKEQISYQNDTQILERVELFPQLSNQGLVADQNSFFYQISYKTTSGKIDMNGGFFAYQPNKLIPSEVTPEIEGITGKYLRLDQILESLDNINISPDQMIDFSVSRICPYSVTESISGNNPKKVINGGGEANSKIAGYIYHNNFYNTVPNDFNSDLHRLLINKNEFLCGKVSIIDQLGNPIFNIPMDYFYPAGNQFYLDYRCYYYSDFTGIYTIVNLNNQSIIFSHGKLPWMGNAWQEYLTRSAEYDREALSINIAGMNQQRNIDIINSVGNGILTGAFTQAGGVAQAGLGFITAEMSRNLQVKQLQREDENKDNRIKNSISQNYQTNYGLDWLYKAIKFKGGGFQIEMPRSFNESLLNNYLEYNGYPCNLYTTCSLSNKGYLQGDIYQFQNINFPDYIDGVIGNIIKTIFKQGVKIV